MADDDASLPRVTHQIMQLIANRPPEVQGGILADMFACWLAGHRFRNEAGERNPGAEKKQRELLIKLVCEGARRLLPEWDRVLDKHEHSAVVKH